MLLFWYYLMLLFKFVSLYCEFFCVHVFILLCYCHINVCVIIFVYFIYLYGLLYFIYIYGLLFANSFTHWNCRKDRKLERVSLVCFRVLVWTVLIFNILFYALFKYVIHPHIFKHMKTRNWMWSFQIKIILECSYEYPTTDSLTSYSCPRKRILRY